MHELLPFTATPALGVMMLNDFTTYLMETDVTKLTWAQYMEVDMHSNGTGLLDYWGNARPSWHTFRFWGDLPIERMVSLSFDESLRSLCSIARNVSLLLFPGLAHHKTSGSATSQRLNE